MTSFNGASVNHLVSTEYALTTAAGRDVAATALTNGLPKLLTPFFKNWTQFGIVAAGTGLGLFVLVTAIIVVCCQRVRSRNSKEERDALNVTKRGRSPILSSAREYKVKSMQHYENLDTRDMKRQPLDDLNEPIPSTSGIDSSASPTLNYTDVVIVTDGQQTKSMIFESNVYPDAEAFCEYANIKGYES